MPGDLNQLAQALRMRPRSGAPFDWDSVRNRLGTDVPTDYKQLVDTYGGGRIDDLFVYQPASPNDLFDLPDASLVRWSDLEDLWESDDYETRPPQLAAPGARAIAWGGSGAGVYLYWIAFPGTAPDDWTVSIEQGRDGDWEHFDVGCVEFLQGILSGDLDSFYLEWVAEDGPWAYEPI